MYDSSDSDAWFPKDCASVSLSVRQPALCRVPLATPQRPTPPCGTRQVPCQRLSHARPLRLTFHPLPQGTPSCPSQRPLRPAWCGQGGNFTGQLRRAGPETAPSLPGALIPWNRHGPASELCRSLCLEHSPQVVTWPRMQRWKAAALASVLCSSVLSVWICRDGLPLSHRLGPARAPLRRPPRTLDARIARLAQCQDRDCAVFESRKGN
ncbi:neurturin isoform X3 [Choloepus didactylus]|uniref:neurturin isoform X3 n=1 Tax=Choloepus didactylus TaxID=27675 RepID=UPI0018A041E8|nr:neurturin isoform X3 [Choloepus didactylus]